MRIDRCAMALVMAMHLCGVASAADSACWELPADDRVFQKLWLTMDSIQKGAPCTLSVLYIGGSHVQGGSIGHGLRAELNHWAPHAERARGMQLPYRIAQTNTPTHFRTEIEGHWTSCLLTRGAHSGRCADSSIGTGVLAFPQSECRIQHVSYYPDSVRATAPAVEMWTNAVREQWSWDGSSPLQQATRLSGGLGWLLEFDAPADTLAITFHCTPSDSIWYAGMCTRPGGQQPAVAVHEWGHNGCRIEHAADQKGWASLLKRLDPDLILVGIGLNDAANSNGPNVEKFGEHYQRWFQSLEATGAAVVILGNTPALSHGKSLAEPNAKINGWLRKFSSERGAGFMDLGAALGGDSLIDEWMKAGFIQADGMHFTATGYERIARLVFQGWKHAYAHQHQAFK